MNDADGRQFIPLDNKKHIGVNNLHNLSVQILFKCLVFLVVLINDIVFERTFISYDQKRC